MESSTITLVDAEYNTTTWAASNLLDGDPRTRWLSTKHINDINFQLNDSNEAICVTEFELINYGDNATSLNQFMLFTTSNSSLSTDSGTEGWRPVVAEHEPIEKIDYLSWAQGARLVSVDSEYNSTSWGVKNLNDGSKNTRWLSRKSNNVIEYNFDTDWNGTAGDGIPISEIEIVNYGANDRSVREFQVEVTTDNVTWSKLEVPGSTAGDEEYVFTRRQDGGILGTINSQLNSTSWGADNLQDGDNNTRWLSAKGNNTIEFTFDPDNSGTSGAQGDVADLFTIKKLNIENYGTDDRSVQQFQVAVKTLANPEWQKIRVPGATLGEADYNFAMSHQGGTLVEIDGQYNTTSWSGANIHDGDANTRWLNTKQNNTLAFQFDVNEDQVLSSPADQFTLERFYLRNYGNDDRSIRQFQVAVKTASNPNWQKLPAPGSTIGEPGFNFLLSHNGGTLLSVDSEHNATTYGAKNIHDGDGTNRWLSRKSNNILEFQFDVDGDGVLGGATDLFSFESFYLKNLGVNDSSIKQFQIEVKTAANPNWKKLYVPGSAIGDPDYNFALMQHGGTLVNIDSQANSTSRAAKNLQDGDGNSVWLSLNSSNVLDFQFDLDQDGSLAGPGDRFKLESFHLVNYGANDLSIKHFQVEVKTAANPDWAKIPVSGSAANDPDYQFSLAIHGGSLTTIDSEYNSSSYAAANLHDGDTGTRWLSRKPDNTLAFTFDTDGDGSSGDEINLDTISLVNYGNNDISIQTFEIDIQISNGAWQTINAPDGGTVFTASMTSNLQTWDVGLFNNVTATRIRTLTNHGDARYTGAYELTFSGPSVGPSYTYTAAMHDNGETFFIDEVNQPVDVTDVRLRTITNHGDRTYIGAKEFRLLGAAVSRSHTFTAAMHGNGETFTLDSDDIPIDVTDVRLITISNHGDRSYTGASEFELLGPSINKSRTFTAAMHGNGETFTLDPVDVPTNVTDVKLFTINNHGDPSYIGAREFKILGPSVSESKTFTAAMHGNGEVFQLDDDDIAVDVTDVKLITINNYGDPSYTGMQEFEVLGDSVNPSNTFTAPMSALPHRIVLDSDDEVTDIIAARVVTIQNHGDRSYTGMAEFKLLGAAITPSYIFSAERDATLQKFPFDPIGANILRFHSLSNHGSNSYVRASEFGLNEGVCKTAQWRMDESRWTGAANEVIDSTGGGYDAVSMGYGVGEDPYTSKDLPALDGDPGSCRYGEFDGVDDYIVSGFGDNLDELSEMTFTAWIKASSFNQTNGTDSRGVFSKGPVGVDAVSYGAFFTNTGGNRLKVDIDGSDDRFVSNTVFDIETWYHIAIVFDGNQAESQRVKLYVNGVLDGTFAETSELIPNTTGDFYIGNLYSAVNEKKVFHGAIDEVNFRPTALSASEIVNLMNTRRSCAVPIHHIQIEHDGEGLTCMAEQLTLKACADAACSVLTPKDVIVTLEATGAASTWSENPITIPAGNSVNVDLSHTTAEVVTLSATANLPTIAAADCTPDCDIEFSNAGFLLSMDNHQACSTTNLSIQAVKLSDTSTSCTAAGSGDLSLDFVFNYANPTSGTKVPNLDSTPMEVATVAQNRVVNFDASGTAVLSFEYHDAGKVSIEVNDAGDRGLASSTVNTVVSPAKLIVASPDANAQCTSNDASCSAFKKAGEAFNLSVTAACADGTVTPNFEMANIPLTIDTVAPLAGNPVALGVTSVSIIDTDNGIHTQANQTVSEVGVFTVTATPPVSGYFGETIAPATSESIGRFTPAYFDLETLYDGFLNGGDPFVYSGQMNALTPTKGQISYSTQPEFSITAKSLGGHTTLNYTGDFVKLQEANIIRVTPTKDDQAIGADGINKVALTANLDSPELTESNGVINYQFNADDNYVYVRDANAVVAPFTANINLEITSVIDSDGIVAQDSDSNATNGVLQLQPFGEEIRFGRWTLKNSFGPEIDELNLPMVLEYWNGDAFVTNPLDNFTTFDAAADASVIDMSLAPATTTPSGSGTFVYGLAEMMLSAPGEGNQGEVKVGFEVPEWLQYDWSNIDGNLDGPYNENPSGIATFGLFRGNDRMIHWREVAN
ncbi:hypothetical protein GCM10009114_07990 [Aliiglaciecola litoralis]|uniref:LamG-like jellyroll fold domain-containing protein n=1 Tax=Aliiglaciecola litoralis TaxID=582857 RepID=A0ABP3WSM9_9ALTE